MNERGKAASIILTILLFISWTLLLLFYLNNKGNPNPSPLEPNKTIPNPDNPRETKVVSKVIDGDTVIIEGDSYRLLGIDSDERGYPCYNPAKKRMEELVLGKGVQLESDVKDKDQYDRYLRYIFLNGQNINLQMVKEGLAVARFYENNKYREEIIDAESYARENKIGCKWSGKSQLPDNNELETPKDYKKEGLILNNTNKSKKVEGYICNTNTYNCDYFRTQKDAQEAFDACGGKENDIHRLDQDKDGIPCESLP